MKVVAHVMLWELRNLVRGRWILAYAALLALLTDALLRTGGGSGRALLGLVHLVLLITPLVSIVFGTLHLYGAREFNELLLSQPVGRRQLFTGLYLGITLPLAAALVLGLVLPFAWHPVQDPRHYGTLAILALVGALLTVAFTALAFFVAVRIEDRARGLGTAILLWLALGIVYDGIVLGVLAGFARDQMDTPALVLMLLNPIDLGRVLVLLDLDLSAMMGYTGAVFRRFFGGTTGAAVALGALAAWVVGPLLLAARGFRRKDF
jgi:Cu-processing system permease protein